MEEHLLSMQVTLGPTKLILKRRKDSEAEAEAERTLGLVYLINTLTLENLMENRF